MFLVDEIFTSIQGESTDAGVPCIFVRLFGCPVGCSYCDTHQTKGQRMSLTRVAETLIKEKDINYVCITGGEPLLQEDTMSLVYEMLAIGKNVSIETSGCVPLEDFGYLRSFKYIIDVKCPSSGVVDKNIYDNLLKLQSNDEVVFVIKDRVDYDFMKGVLRKYNTSAKILVSPMFDKEGRIIIGKDLVSWILEDRLNVRVQVQMHKILGVA